MMKPKLKTLLAVVAGLLISSQAFTSETIYLPNLGTGATGTAVSAKKAMDVYVAGGGFTFTEQATAAQGAAAPSLLKVIAGTDGTNIFGLKTDTLGQLQVAVVSSALPTGAATSAKQDTGNTSLSSIDTKTPALVTGRVPVDGSAVTQPVSAASLPLPTGAATSAAQTTANTSLSSIDTKTPALVTGRVPVDGSGVTQPVSGTVNATQNGTWNITNVSGTVSLPTGAATSANQSTGNTSLASIATNTAKHPINTGGSGSASGATVSTVQTLTAPANAVGFMLMNLDTSTANIRWSVGRTASATLGQQLQPGRDTGFVPVGASVSVIAESGTQNIDIQWVTQ